MTTATAPNPDTLPVTVPVAAGKLGVSLNVLIGLLRRRRDLSDRLFFAGTARMVTADLLGDMRTALAERVGGGAGGGVAGPSRA